MVTSQTEGARLKFSRAEADGRGSSLKQRWRWWRASNRRQHNYGRTVTRQVSNPDPKEDHWSF
jgi:hypothetical protein